MHRLSRRAFVAAASASLSWPIFGAGRSRPTKVLFICQFGSVKSAIAREIFRRRAAERHQSVSVFSRGITPEPHLPLALQRDLLREGIDTARQPLRQLRQADLDAADLVIIFDKLPPDLRVTKVDDWTDTPSVLNDYPRARADLDRRIDELLGRLPADRGLRGRSRSRRRRASSCRMASDAKVASSA